VSKARDYAGDLRRYYLPKARTHASNAWHRAAGRHIQTVRGRLSNARNLRDIQRGRRDLPRRAADQVRSRTPVYRNRINRATGRPHRDDRDMGRSSDKTLTRLADGQRRLREAEARNRASRQPQRDREAWEYGPDTSRSRGVPDPFAARKVPARTGRSPR